MFLNGQAVEAKQRSEELGNETSYFISHVFQLNLWTNLLF